MSCQIEFIRNLFSKKRIDVLLLGALAAFGLFIGTVSLPKNAFSQSELHSPASFTFADQEFTLPVPEGLCNETERPFGKVMALQLEPLVAQMAGLVNPTLFYKECDNPNLLPWGYVSIGPKLPILLTQDQFNQLQSQQLGIDALLDEIGDTVNDILAEEYNDILGDLSLGKVQIVSADDYANISAVSISLANQADAAGQIGLTASTLIKGHAIEFILYIDGSADGQKLQQMIKILHQNAMSLQALNTP